MSNVYDPHSGALTRTVITQGAQQSVLDMGPWGPSKVQHFDSGELRLIYHEQGAQQGQIKELHTPHALALHYAYDAAHRPVAIDCGTTYRLTCTYDAQGRVVRLAHVPGKA